VKWKGIRVIDKQQLTKDLLKIASERYRQDEKWGTQEYQDGTGSQDYKDLCKEAKRHCEHKASIGNQSWAAVLLEEVYEALEETDPEKLGAELIQVAAVCIAWVECIARRKK
jgi:hypothetical protein